MATARVRVMERNRETLGMTFEDVLSTFMHSRKTGTGTAVRVNRPRTLQNYGSDLQYFFDFMRERGHTHWNQVTDKDASDFVGWVRSRPNWTEASQSKRLRSLKALFYFIELDDECKDQAMRGFLRRIGPLPRATSRVKTPSDLPTDAELHIFLTSFRTNTRAGLRDYTAFLVMMDCGARAGEMSWLRMEHIKHLDEHRIEVPEEGKTKRRTVYVSWDTVKKLRDWLEKREKFAQSEFVFCTNQGTFNEPTNFSQSFRRRSLECGIRLGAITPHMLRHYFATEWLRQGGDIAKLRDMTGHESFETLKNYTHLAGDAAVKEEQSKVSPVKRLLKTQRVIKPRTPIK